MYPLRLKDSEYITKYDIDRVICAGTHIEKIEISTAELKQVLKTQQ